MIRIMTKKNTLAEGFGKFLLGLVEVCIAIALMAGTFVASAFLVVQGVFFIRDAYGFYGVATAWLISFMISHYSWDKEINEKKHNEH